MRGRGEIGRHSGLRSQRPRHESSSLSVRTKLTKTAWMPILDYSGLFFIFKIIILFIIYQKIR